MRRLIVAVGAVLSLVCASPAAAQLQDYKSKGSIQPCKYEDRQLDDALADLPPDIEQYVPGYAEQLRNARGAPCGSRGTQGTGGTTTGANERVEGVPAPPAAGGGPGGSGAKPPVPVAVKQTRLADVTSPVIASRPTGPDVPAWALALVAVVLLAGLAIAALGLLGADLSRFIRPLGVAAGDARTRISDRAIQLWETVRLGR